MNNIPITTAQNIVVFINKASLGKRFFATLIDWFIIYFLVMFVTLSLSSEFVSYIMYLFVLFYQLMMETFNDGQSLGKMLLKIKVISLSGGKPNFESLLIRWSFRLIDLIGSMGFIGITSIISSKYGQRLGDQLADTIVVSLNEVQEVSLTDLKGLDQHKIEKFEFPKIAELNDETMLLVKKIIERYNTNPTPENQMVAKEMADILAKEVNLKEQRPIFPFLNQLLSEYVQLTR